MTQKVVLLILSLCITSISYSQDTAEDELGSWYVFSVNTKLDSKLKLNTQTQFRYYQFIKELQQFKFRVGLEYTFHKNFSVRVGYAYFETDPSFISSQPPDFIEQRIFEDLNLTQSIGFIKVLHRYRIEHRFFNRVNGNDTEHWIRYLLQLKIPIKRKFVVDVFDEVFLNTQSPVFAQNWLGGGITYKAGKKLNFRVAYFRINSPNENFNRLIFQTTLNLDFKKQQL